MEIIQEIPKGNSEYPNHIYFLNDAGKLVAYIKEGTKDIIRLKSPIMFDKRYRNFIKVKDKSWENVIPKDKNVRIFLVKSKEKEYNVSVRDNSKYTCTCTGFSYRGKCKHVEAVRSKLC